MIPEICRDFSRFLNISRLLQDFFETSGSKILTNWEIWIEKYDKIDQLSIEIETNCQDLPKMSCLERFLNLDRDFWDWKVVSRQNRDFSISNFLKMLRFSRLSRLTLCQCQDRDSQSRSGRDKSRPPGLINAPSAVFSRLYCKSSYLIVRLGW
jgi:hypothetical protein